MEREEMGLIGESPTWAVEAHRWPTHSGESPLLAHGFLSPSKMETTNGFSKLPTNQSSGKPIRVSAPPAGSNNGVVYYRPTRSHQFLAASDLKDGADCEDLVRYGRPTRTTLLRARQKLNSSAMSFELRRQLDQRMEEIRLTCAFSNPREFLQLHPDIDGESFYSFLTGARYNRAHYVDSKCLSQHGVYMPRHNPLACFVLPHKADGLDTSSAPPDSPRSDNDEEAGSNLNTTTTETRARPTTAPGHGGKRGLGPMPHAPHPPPRQAWGDSITTSVHLPPSNNDGGGGGVSPPKAENSAAVTAMMPGFDESYRPLTPHQLRVRGSRVPINSSREGQFRFEGKLPKLRPFREYLPEDYSFHNQPPPTPVPPYVRVDSSHLPAVRQEAETKPGAAHAQETDMEMKTAKQTEDEKPTEEKTTEEDKKEEKSENKEESLQKIEEEKEENTEEQTREEEKPEDMNEEAVTEGKGAERQKDEEDAGEEEREKLSEKKDEENTEQLEEEKKEDMEHTEEEKDVPETETAAGSTELDNQNALPQQQKDDVKFFLTEGAGAVIAENDVTTSPNQATAEEENGATAPTTGVNTTHRKNEEETLQDDAKDSEATSVSGAQNEAVGS
ncbi:uncharacterized protein LOC143275525 isoform X2 [Babylonia areolata]